MDTTTVAAPPVGDPNDLVPTDAVADPFELFAEWFDQARATEVNDPNAMALATTDPDGLPDVRMVLLKDADPAGFVFYTNVGSSKGVELAANMRAAGVLHWKTQGRQVRFRGPVERVTDAEADAYFASRARHSRIGAWASRQSRPLRGRDVLDADVRREAERFGDGDIPRPPHWSGFRIRPVYLEFWTNMPFRLHDRLVFRRDSPNGAWERGRLYP
jgi:pyridoxamine 5'-phosphate oxidase